ncbi:MAG: AAA family ATPase, partial [Nocardioidaceae bacterium]|nr:AAA family ATPase [Nocardioidaceae bacterium]
LMLLGRAGSGKTTLAQQWAMGRCGLPGFSTLLGLPVPPGERRTLYLAMDRPRQAVRSIRRMVTSEMREGANERLTFWPGPPPVDLTRNPDALGEMCATADADSVVVDSLKDAGSVVDDEGGTGWNAARQRALVAGIAVLELHHPRKSDGDTPTLETAYGSTWLTAGAGSVLAITGKPGDALVRVDHLEQPAEPGRGQRLLGRTPSAQGSLVERSRLDRMPYVRAVDGTPQPAGLAGGEAATASATNCWAAASEATPVSLRIVLHGVASQVRSRSWSLGHGRPGSTPRDSLRVCAIASFTISSICAKAASRAAPRSATTRSISSALRRRRRGARRLAASRSTEDQGLCASKSSAGQVPGGRATCSRRHRRAPRCHQGRVETLRCSPCIRRPTSSMPIRIRCRASAGPILHGLATDGWNSSSPSAARVSATAVSALTRLSSM